MTMVLISLLSVTPQPAALRPTAVTWGGHLLIADGKGGVHAWNAGDLSFDDGFSKQLAGERVIAIAAGNTTLWGFDGTRALQWEARGALSRWVALQAKPPPGRCNAFAVVREDPVCVCGPGVFRFPDARYWAVPLVAPELARRGFGELPLSLAVHEAQLALGTGLGEWGGTLWLLDVTTGNWKWHSDALGNPVGVASTSSGWAVAWSMSHFLTTTRVRLHRADATPLEEGPVLEGRYLRALSADGQGQLLGVEQQELVHVTETLTIEAMQSVGQVAYGLERHAAGVSSGIAAFVTLVGTRALIVSDGGEGRVVGAGKSKILAVPHPTTAAPRPRR